VFVQSGEGTLQIAARRRLAPSPGRGRRHSHPRHGSPRVSRGEGKAPHLRAREVPGTVMRR
jgi:hypothetical protein